MSTTSVSVTFSSCLQLVLCANCPMN